MQPINTVNPTIYLAISRFQESGKRCILSVAGVIVAPRSIDEQRRSRR